MGFIAQVERVARKEHICAGWPWSDTPRCIVPGTKYMVVSWSDDEGKIRTSKWCDWHGRVQRWSDVRGVGDWSDYDLLDQMREWWSEAEAAFERGERYEVPV